MTDYTPLYLKWFEFHMANPHVWKIIEARALAAIRGGVKRLSISKLVEEARADVRLATTRTDDFKINNDHRAYYARLFNWKYPHGPQCETRTVKGGLGPFGPPCDGIEVPW